MPVEVANESEIAVDEAELAGVCRFVLGEMKVNPMAELSVLCVDVEYMSSLHERWMGEKGPTDVLAFPMDELDTARPDDPEPGPALLGDVVLCPAVAVRQARAAGHSHGRRTGAAGHPRRAAPARLRPHGARRGEGDVRSPAEAPRGLAVRAARARDGRARDPGAGRPDEPPERSPCW